MLQSNNEPHLFCRIKTYCDLETWEIWLYPTNNVNINNKNVSLEGSQTQSLRASAQKTLDYMSQKSPLISAFFL